MKASVSGLLAFIAAFSAMGVVRAQDRQQDQEWPRFHIGVALGKSHSSHSLSEVGGVPEQAWGTLRWSPTREGSWWSDFGRSA